MPSSPHTASEVPIEVQLDDTPTKKEEEQPTDADDEGETKKYGYLTDEDDEHAHADGKAETGPPSQNSVNDDLIIRELREEVITKEKKIDALAVSMLKEQERYSEMKSRFEAQEQLSKEMIGTIKMLEQRCEQSSSAIELKDNELDYEKKRVKALEKDLDEANKIIQNISSSLADTSREFAFEHQGRRRDQERIAELEKELSLLKAA